MEKETKAVETKAVETKAVDSRKDKKSAKKKTNFFKRTWIKIKEVFSELKKVTWPTFPKVVKQTGVVIGVVAIFLVVITLMDLGLSAVLDLLLNAK